MPKLSKHSVLVIFILIVDIVKLTRWPIKNVNNQPNLRKCGQKGSSIFLVVIFFLPPSFRIKINATYHISPPKL